MKMAAALLALALAGCAATFQAPPPPVIAPVQEEADQPRPLCLVRARLFQGLVQVPCGSLAQEFRP
jgi:hypothetical protein